MVNNLLTCNLACKEIGATNPRNSRIQTRKFLRRYTDNRYRRFVQEDRLADGMGVSPKRGLPIAVAQHGDGELNSRNIGYENEQP